MIFSRNLLVIKILFENTSRRALFGVYRPSAYMEETGNYFTTLRIDLFKKEIAPGENIVVNAILEAPVGYGRHLKEGAVLKVCNGFDVEGKAMVLDILGNLDEL